MELSEFRGLFPITRTRSYLFSGALAPAATPVRAAFESWSDRWMHDPLFNYNNFAEELEALRAAFARLIGTDPSAVAITDNTSRGSNLAVRLLANRAGSNVVVDDTTYPSSIYPWITMSDKELRYVPTDERPDGAAALAERVDAGTVAVTVSHVAPLTGRRHDLAAIAKVVHDQGGLLVVDAAQTTGVVPIDVTADGVDILTTTSMK